MMKNHFFQERIGFRGNIVPILSQVCEDYGIGNFRSYNVVPTGYEDFNLVLTTSESKFFVKMFATFREQKDCQRYIDVLQRTLEAGVSHPKLYESSQGVLYETEVADTQLRLCVLEHIDGKSFHELKRKPTPEEAKTIIGQAALINSINMRPGPVYDSWAIMNFLEEYRKKKKYLAESDVRLIEPIVDEFASLKIKRLPHCLVHGDIISTNVMLDKKGKVYIIDFAVANHGPRINELAVLLNDLFFDPKDPEKAREYYDFVLSEYQRHLPLTKEEIPALKTFTRVGHAMHIIAATYSKAVRHGIPAENRHWIALGRAGLRLEARV
jgi:Ser/Thr protein kinase RdoA (MazF antagonist)